MSTRQYLAVLTRELATFGVDRWHIDRSHHHPRLIFEWDGREISYVMAGSSSDWRSMRNAVSSLRRVMGVRQHKKPKNRSPHPHSVARWCASRMAAILYGSVLHAI
jgi:hypothetical protein